MKIRETIQEIGFYIGLILIGWFLCLHVEPNKIGIGHEIIDKIMTRLTGVEDSIGKLNTQGLIKQSLEKTKGH